jgi:hypothetical protein
VATFTILYYGSDERTEDVEAEDYIDEGDWITFRDWDDGGRLIRQVLRIRQKDVKRIDRKG